MGLFGKSDKEKEADDIAKANEARAKLDAARRKQAEREAAAGKTAPGTIGSTASSAPAAPAAPAGRAAVPVSQPVGGDEVYTVVKGDSLSKIAKKHLGSAGAWRKIYEANKDVIGSNPDLIKPGQKLRLPKADAAGAGPKSA
jgi:nucleoid-associated protein YgaU